MLAPRKIPDHYLRWNKVHHAPYGRDMRGERYIRGYLPASVSAKILGMFSIQPNNDTRRFEYPWAIDAAQLSPGMRGLDLGGGLAGFQFILARLGVEVTNVDPGTEAKGVGWPCTPESIATLNAAFGTSVRLVNATLPEAKLPEASFDRVFSISVLEHLREQDFDATLAEVLRVLKPGGLFVLTTDLFLDLKPFTSRLENEWGCNFPVGKLLSEPGFEVIVGDPSQLYGCAEFNHDAIQSDLAKYLVGGYYPVLVQCLVLRKRA
jgi:SAM-dependent methyltransferase